MLGSTPDGRLIRHINNYMRIAILQLVMEASDETEPPENKEQQICKHIF